MRHVDDKIVDEQPVIDASEPVSEWFGLSYSGYLVLQRSLLEAMPTRWQREFVALLRELDAEFDTWDERVCGSFWVRAKGADGRFIEDPLGQYRRPNRELIEALRRKHEH